MDIFNTFIKDPVFNALIFFYNLVGDLGLAIIIITLLIRLILLPLANRSFRSQRRLQALQPEIQKLQEKHKDDRETLAKEMMAFYRKEGVSPASSCLPMLVQLPIIIALFYVFKDAAAAHNFNHLYHFIDKPTNFDPHFLGLVDLSKPDRFVLPVITGLLQFFQSKMLMPKTDAKITGPAAMNKQLIYFLPLITVVFASALPAALPLYWATQSAFTIVQQYVIIRSMPEATARAEGAADWNAANPQDAIAAPQGKKRGKQAQVTVRKRNK